MYLVRRWICKIFRCLCIHLCRNRSNFQGCFHTWLQHYTLQGCHIRLRPCISLCRHLTRLSVFGIQIGIRTHSLGLPLKRIFCNQITRHLINSGIFSLFQIYSNSFKTKEINAFENFNFLRITWILENVIRWTPYIRLRNRVASETIFWKLFVCISKHYIPFLYRNTKKHNTKRTIYSTVWYLKHKRFYLVN